MRLVGCDLCGSEEAILRFASASPRVFDGGPAFRVVECRGCGLLFLNPRPEGTEMASYYPDAYYDGLESTAAHPARRSSALRRLRKRVRRALLERLYGYPATYTGSRATSRPLRETAETALLHLERWRLRISGREAAIIPFVGEGRLLDVGCGTGKDLAAFIEAGWNVTGIEASRYAAWLARERLGCEILVGDFDEVPLRDGSFDVVRFSHSLEHLASPRRALEKAYRALRPGGRLFIELPNAASLDRRIFGRHWAGWRLPQHLYHFTPDTLARLLVCTRFQAVRTTCHGREAFLVESLLNVFTGGFGVRLRRTAWLSVLARPLAYATGMMRRGMILSVHAEKCLGGNAALPVGAADRPRREQPR